MVTVFDTLYSLNSNGSIQEWNILVKENTIIKRYGQSNGKIQETSDTIEKGKNIGKANATTPEQQALKEAQSQWEKKLKSGYVLSIDDAINGKVNEDFVEGGVEPMLAHKFRDHESKIIYPAYAQPKLDGIRCIAVVENGKCTLWTRTRKPITGVPHIIRALEETFPNESIILDGELYNHKYKNNFEEIVSFVRQETPKEGHEVVEYHVYDIVSEDNFGRRGFHLNNIKFVDYSIIKVETEVVDNTEELMLVFSKHRESGYEGTMIRNAHGPYEGKRSYNLQKLKEFDDAEFRIIGAKSGRGRMAECAIFLCITKDGNEFDCKMRGSLDRLKEILSNPKKVIGKMLTVKYQGITNGNVPRFPVGVSVRDYE